MRYLLALTSTVGRAPLVDSRAVCRTFSGYSYLRIRHSLEGTYRSRRVRHLALLDLVQVVVNNLTKELTIQWT